MSGPHGRDQKMDRAQRMFVIHFGLWKAKRYESR